MLSADVWHGPLPSQWIVPSSLIIVLDFDVLGVVVCVDGWWWSNPNAMLSLRCPVSLLLYSVLAMAWYGCDEIVVSLSEPGEPNGRLGNASRMVPFRLIAGDFCGGVDGVCCCCGCWNVCDWWWWRCSVSEAAAAATATATATAPLSPFLSFGPSMDPVGANAVLAAFELYGLFVDDTVMSIDTVDRLAGQKHTWERDYLYKIEIQVKYKISLEREWALKTETMRNNNKNSCDNKDTAKRRNNKKNIKYIIYGVNLDRVTQWKVQNEYNM